MHEVLVRKTSSAARNSFVNMNLRKQEKSDKNLNE